MYGGYDDGYEKCPCFWGATPGSLVGIYETLFPNIRDIRVCDLGCGEGKNAIYLARKGAKVKAYDISQLAIKNALNAWDDSNIVDWNVQDIQNLEFAIDSYDLVIAYGLFHCFPDESTVISFFDKVKKGLKIGGCFLLCAFNNRYQDLSGHENFSPLLLEHEFYMNLFKDFEILYCTDENLVETHPNNNIEHTHSMTRIIAKRSL